MEQSEKQKEWKQKEFQKNKEAHRVKQQVRRKAIRKLIENLKSPCIICGEDEKCCIDFHHIDSNEKEFVIADATKRKWSDKKIILEIEKCVCLCANHHRLLHYYELTVEELIEKYKNIVL